MTRGEKLTIFVSAVVALLLAFSPFAVKCISGDSLFDGVFGRSFGSLPVSMGGRVMPMSSAAADVLKSFSGKSSAKIDGAKMSATKWLWTANAQPERAESAPLIRTDNRDLQKLLDADGRYVKYSAVSQKYESLAETAAGKDPYAKSCRETIAAASSLGMSLNALGIKHPDAKSAKETLAIWRKAVADAESELSAAAKQKRRPDDSKLVAASAYLNYLNYLAKFERQNNNAVVKTVWDGGEFKTPVQAMLDRKLSERASKLLQSYAETLDAVSAGDRVALEKGLAEISQNLGDIPAFRLRAEALFNAFDPFFAGLILYAFAFVCLALSKIWSGKLGCAGGVFLTAGVVVHLAAMAARMYIQMRPPVTNFYSSVVFTGALAAAFGLFLFAKKGSYLAALAAAFGGLLSLVVAVNLPYSGDTMAMMRAVLNSNFWLTAHVTTIMIGYCGLFLAGWTASLRLVCNAFSKTNFGAETTKTADGVYVLLCVCLLFTFTGTMLGGIWADMSWGRFWGWDPKENGALMIVLWTAGVIHCRLLKVCNDRFFLALAALGNVVVAWAWFGVNMMGIGLHSYGFTEGGWLWLIIFIFLQISVAPFAFIVYKSE